ncbi:MAG: protease modulator HflC [Caulobacterales bacterium]|nr:protease modulator HflC [Caulobacterales bacterium]
MTNQRGILYGIVAAIALFFMSQTFYVIGQTEQALITNVGTVVRTVNVEPDDGPGLKMKIPFLETARVYPKLNLNMNIPRHEILAGNQERLMIDAFVRYRISDPVKFYTRLGEFSSSPARLGSVVNASLRQVLGTASSEEIISTKRSQLMRRMRVDLGARARASGFGVEVIDVRIRTADLPDQNQAAVFDRMRTARQQEAARIRATGLQQQREIIATATQEAETIRGQADAERAKIFASSFGKDPSFAAFYRSMQAYEASMAKGDTTLVLSPDSAFFRYFSKGGGG